MPRQKSSHKCKHCTFETDNKVDHWQHMKLHMRPDKILECSSCQFVTPYKHHLEYHQRNHIGYKPFKCENCDYQCVNKSMLNSHMRSHSSVYQYQCGDCKYATKYIHSLRTHLMKYSHQEDQMSGYGFSTKKTSQPETQEPCILDLRVSSKIRQENSIFNHN